MKLRASGMKSRVRARSMVGRSILLGQFQIEVGHGAEAADASYTQTTFQGAARALLDFSAGEFFRDQPRRFTAWRDPSHSARSGAAIH
jgi:hypothetical protein